jgi:hypothetical protein
MRNMMMMMMTTGTAAGLRCASCFLYILQSLLSRDEASLHHLTSSSNH